ncbi:hypothetical protein QAD02_015882, partial [Eretmocerus hayati]
MMLLKHQQQQQKKSEVMVAQHQVQVLHAAVVAESAVVVQAARAAVAIATSANSGTVAGGNALAPPSPWSCIFWAEERARRRGSRVAQLRSQVTAKDSGAGGPTDDDEASRTCVK